ncbi:MAG TPA: DUF1003 domain-containing protein [Anaerolineae bacterium]|nr:DUF1003 domain-containing protein [Anaerolineae bacterium]
MSSNNFAPNRLQFPSPFKHRHPVIQNVNDVFQEQLTTGQRTADSVARIMGSWNFIIIQSVFFFFWIVLNVTGWIYEWDPYPFILMNLALSLQAAYAAPIIMMSQNRQATRDRLEAHNDFLINQKAEEEIRAILNHLAAQDLALAEIHQLLFDWQNSPPPDEDSSTKQNI